MNLNRYLLLSLALVTTVATAQWQWLDKDGRKVYSDRPPPVDIPDRSILKQPGNRAGARAAAIAAMAEASASAASAPASAASGPKLAGEEKALIEKRKQAYDAEGARVQAVQEKISALKRENCNRARQAKVQLESAMRVRRMNDKGEREVMDAATRDAEAQRVQGIIDSDC